MKKIFIVLFLILTISIPAFAKKQKAEPDWVPIMTATDGTEWFYDVNTIKKVMADTSYTMDIKSSKGGINKIDNYWIRCYGYGEYDNGNPLTGKLIWTPSYSVRKSRWSYKDKGPIQKGHFSENLYNEFCKGK